ncbi:hypothetical protein PFICI_13864 [Pestalotiopsis fici W106-1]|uniref:Probable Xaa-Pro aminopeptidase P n=1 Tax=Pestalotiopsis fici (strain W106-1 / CGMCC3.15140) TaxID=1229662 RepID=W3WJE1_PESFW|nr:uncharacterized protein PFICI_13864 [Pestalotiopsis fici W106-1]ETS73998.1 hypothetical protein PFICI_13864 [Pestalotiopsis fici W106-1]
MNFAQSCHLLDFKIPQLSRLHAARMERKLDILIIFDSANNISISRFNPLFTTHDTCLVLFPNGTSFLFVEYIRRRAELLAAEDKLAPDLRVVVFGAPNRNGCSNLWEAIHQHMLVAVDFSRFQPALQTLLEHSEVADLAGLKIGYDRKYTLGQKIEEAEAAFPGAEFIDFTNEVDKCKSVLDEYSYRNNIIGAELVHVAFRHALQAISFHATATEASWFAHAALETYRSYYYPSVSLAGVGARNDINLNGCDINIVQGYNRPYEESVDEVLRPGEPWTLTILITVNGTRIEFLYTGGNGMPRKQSIAMKLGLAMQVRLSDQYKPNITFDEMYNDSNSYASARGFKISRRRIGHGINLPVHAPGSIIMGNRSVIPLGFAITYQPPIIGMDESGGPIHALFGNTCIMMDQGLMPITSSDPEMRGNDKIWTIYGQTMPKPEWKKAANFHKSYESYRTWRAQL